MKESAKVVAVVSAKFRLVETAHKYVYTVRSEEPVGTVGLLWWVEGSNPQLIFEKKK